MAKQQPSIVIDKLGTHLLRVTNNHTGQVDLKWDWDKLLEEVQAATSIDVTIDAEVVKGLKKKGINVKKEVTQALAKEGLNADINVKPAKKAAKRDLVKETETKVTKTRAKKTTTAKKSTK